MEIVAPVVRTEVMNQRISEGDTISLTCQATGKPIPNITWYFNDIPMEKANAMDYVISEMSLNPITKNSTLTIFSAQTSEMGTYTCNAANLVSSKSSSTMLIVNGECFVNVHVFMYIKDFHTSDYRKLKRCFFIANL